jgi:hypothetical protein
MIVNERERLEARKDRPALWIFPLDLLEKVEEDGRTSKEEVGIASSAGEVQLAQGRADATKSTVKDSPEEAYGPEYSRRFGSERGSNDGGIQSERLLSTMIRSSSNEGFARKNCAIVSFLLWMRVSFSSSIACRFGSLGSSSSKSESISGSSIQIFLNVKERRFGKLIFQKESIPGNRGYIAIFSRVFREA